MLNVGVIGTGNIGTDHAQRLSTRIAGTAVAAVFDVDTGRAAQVARAAGAVAHTQAVDVIGDPSVDAIVIASPGDTHVDLLLACLDAGKPVLCEKPLATTAASALKVVEAEVALGRRLIQVGFMRRYDQGFRVVKAAIDDGSIGVPLLAHCVHRNATVPSSFTTDMAMTDSVIHEIDTLRWLLGQEIVAATVITGRSTPLAATHLRDPQIVLFETENGTVAEVESFVNCQYGYDVRCEIVGSAGAVSLDPPSANSFVAGGRRTQAVPADWRVRFETAYIDELQRWADGVALQTVGGPSSWDGFAAAAVAEACVASQASGGRVAIAPTPRPDLYAPATSSS